MASVTAVMHQEPLPEATGQKMSSLEARGFMKLAPESAESWLQQGLEDHGRSLTYFELCRLYWQDRRQDEAVAACRAGDVPAIYWVNLGLQAEQEKDFTLALAAYETAVAVEPQAAAAWFRLGHIRFVTQAYAQVIPAHQQALATGYPPQSSLYEEIGRASLQLDEVVAAKEAFAAGLRLFPDSRPLYLDMVSASRQEGDWQTADDWLARLLEQWPEDSQAWVLRGEIAWQQKQFTEALAYYQQAAYYKPERLDAWLGTVQAATKLGDVSQTATAYSQIMTLSPAQPTIWLQAGEFFWQQNQLEKARTAFEQVLNLDPTNQQAQERLATLNP